MKKFKFGTVLCLILVVAMLVPFGSIAAEGEEASVFVTPEYKSYTPGGESTLQIELDYEPEVFFGFNVIDTATGEVYESNPVRSADNTKSQSTERQKTEFSQLVLKYNYDENGNRDNLENVGYVSSANKMGTFYSYNDCVVRDQLEIFALDVDGNVLDNSAEIIARIKAGEKLSEEEKNIVRGYKVVYGLGNINPELYAQAISFEDMEAYCANLVDENGNPDEKAIKNLVGKYKLFSMEVMQKDKENAIKRARDEVAKKKAAETQDELIKEYQEKYPGLAETEGYQFYELYPDSINTKAKKNKLIEAWVAAGLTKEGLETIYENMGYQASGSGVSFYIPVVYMIEGNTFKVEVLLDEIDYPPEVAIVTLDVIPHFASVLGSEVENGYTFLPDGSGAIIEHDSSDTRVTSIQVALSNRHKDEALSRTGNNISAIPYFEQSILPVFGMKQDDRAVFGIVEKGYEVANVGTNLCEGAQNQYNYSYTSFYPTATDEIYYTSGDAAGVVMFPKYTVPTEVEVKVDGAVTTKVQNWNYCRLPDTNLQVRYNFLYNESANYVGMANYFRQYLIDVYGLERVEASENTTFYADIYGAIQKKVSILGFPFEKKFAITDFEEAEIVVDALLGKVGDLSVRYLGMANGSYRTTDYSDHFKPLYALGGRKGYSEFLDSMSSKGVAIYPDVDPTHVYVDKSFDGFMPYFDAVRTMGKQANIIEDHNLATGLYATATSEDQEYYFPRWAVSPANYEELFANLMTELDETGNKSVSLSQVGSILSADYDESLIIDRTQSSRAISQALESYKAAGYDVIVETGNYWALPYVDAIMKIPTTSSKFLVEDYEVPFLQMAIHGMIEYTGEEINTVQDSAYQILKCLEYGCNLSARLMYEEDMVFQNTYYTTLLYSMHYENWIDEIGEMYTTVNDILKDVQDQYIVNHEMLATNVFVTTYENGLTIAVNYNNEAATVLYGDSVLKIAGNGFEILNKGE